MHGYKVHLVVSSSDRRRPARGQRVCYDKGQNPRSVSLMMSPGVNMVMMSPYTLQRVIPDHSLFPCFVSAVRAHACHTQQCYNKQGVAVNSLQPPFLSQPEAQPGL
jgi:hypothetical protein